MHQASFKTGKNFHPQGFYPQIGSLLPKGALQKGLQDAQRGTKSGQYPTNPLPPTGQMHDRTTVLQAGNFPPQQSFV